MDEQNTKPESSFVNTATQKTVRLKPMVKQPVVNLGQPTKVSSVTTNSQPLATSIIEEKNNVNTTRPAPLPTTATMPVKKISTGARPIGGGSSILNSLNLKSAGESPAVASAPAVKSSNMSSTNTAVVSKVKIADTVSEAFKDTIASSVAPTQKFVPTSHLDTSTAKVQKVDVSNVNAGSAETDDKTVRLQRPQRKQATVANTIVPALTPKAEEPKVEVKVEEKAEVKTEEDNTSTVAVDKVAAPVTPKISIAPKIKTPEASKAEESVATSKEPEKIDALAAPKAPEKSAAPTVKLSLGKKEESTPAEAPKIPALSKKEEPEVTAKPKIGIAKKPEAPKAEPKAEAKDDENIDLKKTEKVPEEQKVKILKPKDTVSPLRSPAYMIIMIIVFFMVVFGAAVSAIQYLNTFEQERVLKGKTIEIPIINNFINK